MRLLLDTCALLWLDQAPERLSDQARAAMSTAPELAFSAISAFEIAIKVAKGQLLISGDAPRWIIRVTRQHGLVELPVTAAIASAVPSMRLPHNDPCDRIIAATAIQAGLAVVTSDQHLRTCPDLTCIW